jgi:catechol 2,3-dioxygenase-like lactoylglutathione lyase family enzyme
MSNPQQMVSVRYMVEDVQAAIDFYTGPLGVHAGFQRRARLR